MDEPMGVPMDLTGNGQRESLGFDTTGDGRVDAVDTNGDGDVDSRIVRDGGGGGGNDGATSRAKTSEKVDFIPLKESRRASDSARLAASTRHSAASGVYNT